VGPGIIEGGFDFEMIRFRRSWLRKPGTNGSYRRVECDGWPKRVLAESGLGDTITTDSFMC